MPIFFLLEIGRKNGCATTTPRLLSRALSRQAAPVHKRDEVVGVVARRGEQAPQPHHDKLPALEHGLHALVELAHPLSMKQTCPTV